MLWKQKRQDQILKSRLGSDELTFSKRLQSLQSMCTDMLNYTEKFVPESCLFFPQIETKLFA